MKRIFLILTSILLSLQSLYAQEKENIFSLRTGSLVDAGWDYSLKDETDSNEFFLERGQLDIESVLHSSYALRLTLEAVRSGGRTSQFGIDGNSIVLRIRNAYGQVGFNVWKLNFSIKAGIIPDIFLNVLENTYIFRGISKTFSERRGYHTPSDAGVILSISLLEDIVRLSAMLSNGEGYNEMEKNTGKDITVMLSSSPLKLKKHNLTIALAYRNGSIGAGAAENSAVSSMAAYNCDIHSVSIGAEYTYSMGYGGVSSRNTDGLGIWAGGDIWKDRLGIFGRFDSVLTDSAWDNSGLYETTAGIYGVPLKKEYLNIRLYFSWRRTQPQKNYGTLPGGGDLFKENRFTLNMSINAGHTFNFTEK